MGVMFLIVFFLVSFLIVGLVLLQEGKGGGLTGMSAGMDGVMGARNPLRRMTAYLFVAFILMAVGINVYFHNRTDNSLPAGAVLPDPVRTLQQDLPSAGTEVLPEGALRPGEEPADAGAPIRPDAAPAAPVMSIRPEGDAAPAAPVETTRPPESPAPAETPNEGAPALRPETAPEPAPAASLQPPSAAAAESVAPPPAQ